MKDLIAICWRKGGPGVRKATFAAACAVLALSACPAGAGTLLSYWDFNNGFPIYQNSSPSNPGSFSGTDPGYGEVYSSSTKLLTANGYFGLYTGATIDMSGLAGTANGGNTGATSWGQWRDATMNLASGQTSNLYGGDGTSTQYGGLLMTINNTSGSSSVTDTLIFNLDTVGYQGISLSYAGRYYGTNPTFTWSYSTDGTNYTTLTPTKTGSLTAAGSFYDISYAFGSSLDNLSAVSLKLSFTANAGVNLSYGIDNLQVLASSPLAVPEPSAWLLFGAGGMLLALAGRARRRSFPVFQS